MRPFDDIDRLAAWPALDRIAAPARDLVNRVLTDRKVADVLHGVPIGHPLHPVLAQLTFGSFLSAGILDLVPRTRRPATALIGVGLLSAAPTAAAGWADYAQAHEEQQRVGIVHAAANITMLAGYVASLAARARGRGFRGALWGWAALAVGSAGAALGGHLSYHQSLGPNHAEPYAHIGPEDWVDVGAVAELPEGTPVQRTTGDVGVVVVRRGDEVLALGERCPHASAPLSDGELTTADGAECVVCPWHGSVFRLTDGGVVHGPATAPAAVFPTRVRDGRLELRVATWPGVPAG
ncbi:Rieske (2Fe-2S) protein [Actinomycetospora sp. TBRC 11914]|uniref:Rieske 2Fe-2S domain-containing protein n=1 Tax=Actinomycetospora sp. TBRC 11914 TaxID=2729387 RepID=UPI00145EF80C|nr:Rieske (2Fe-2S) protein [Actinomycetospora sp. TBRC 11914]NMO90944.1 Rieske (2Fe-2S) protein [Actinomycetospora sp. TBRC 11914]